MEQAGFIDSFLYLTEEFTDSFRIEVFQEELVPQFSKLVSSSYGKVKLLFKNELKEVPEYIIDPPVDVAYTEFIKDTLQLWFKDTSTITMYIQDDTIAASLTLEQSYLDTDLNLSTNIPGSLTLSPIDSLELNFRSPILSVEADSIMVTDTSGNRKTVETFIHEKRLKITGNWSYTDSLFNVIIKPSAISDIHNRTNDTLTFSFVVAPLEKFGDIIFTLEEMDSNYHYLVDLMKGNNSVHKLTVKNSTDTIITYKTLPQANAEPARDSISNAKTFFKHVYSLCK